MKCGHDLRYFKQGTCQLCEEARQIAERNYINGLGERLYEVMVAYSHIHGMPENQGDLELRTVKLMLEEYTDGYKTKR